MPELYLFGGPNGAGKTTVALGILPALGCRHFVNADLIARGLAPLPPVLSPLGGEVDFEAGALMMRRLRKLRESGEDIATESTLAARSFAPFARECRSLGYRVHLFYLWLPSAEMAEARVAARVRAGGHGIPPEVIRRRHEAGRQNFRDLYRAEADCWRAYDNSSEPRLIAQGGRERAEEVRDQDAWREIIR